MNGITAKGKNDSWQLCQKEVEWCGYAKYNIVPRRDVTSDNKWWWVIKHKKLFLVIDTHTQAHTHAHAQNMIKFGKF